MHYRPAFLLILCLLLPTILCAQPVRFGPLPLFPEHQTKQEFYPFTQYLEKSLQRPIECIYRDTYREIAEGLKEDKIDLALLGPLPYTVLHLQDPEIVPLVKFADADGKLGYTCSIGVFGGDDLVVSDLKAKSFALTQPTSTCGFLMTEQMLNDHGLSLEDNSYEYIGQHTNAALAVIEGKADACGIKTSIGLQFADLGLVLIKESPPIPSFVLVANRRTLEQVDIDRIRESLLNIKPLENADHAAVTKNWSQLIKYGSTPVAPADFQTIIDLLNEKPIPGVNR